MIRLIASLRYMLRFIASLRYMIRFIASFGCVLRLIAYGIKDVIGCGYKLLHISNQLNCYGKVKVLYVITSDNVN